MDNASKENNPKLEFRDKFTNFLGKNQPEEALELLKPLQPTEILRFANYYILGIGEDQSKMTALHKICRNMGLEKEKRNANAKLALALVRMGVSTHAYDDTGVTPIETISKIKEKIGENCGEAINTLYTTIAKQEVQQKCGNWLKRIEDASPPSLGSPSSDTFSVSPSLSRARSPSRSPSPSR